MAEFKPFELDGTPMMEQIMNWRDMAIAPYDKNTVDAYTRTRVILMNGIENNSVLTSHALSRMIGNEEILMALAYIRRVDSQQQQVINWLNPANQSVAETTVAYEQVAVDLTSNLAKHEPDPYVKQALDFALLEDFDHLFRYGCLLELLHGIDPHTITQGKTEIKPGRPTVIEHRHPFDTLRQPYDAKKAGIKTKLNYWTIVSAEQQTMLYYKAHGFMYDDSLARQLYTEIAEVEEEHVTQYELLGDPRETPLEKMALCQLNEAYNYYSCAMTETDDRLRDLWAQCAEAEITHFLIIDEQMQKYETRSMSKLMKTDTIAPLIVFEPNKDYVNQVLATQLELQPHDKEFVPADQLPSTWLSFAYRDRVNAGGSPAEDVANRAKDQGKWPKAA